MLLLWSGKHIFTCRFIFFVHFIKITQTSTSLLYSFVNDFATVCSLVGPTLISLLALNFICRQRQRAIMVDGFSQASAVPTLCGAQNQKKGLKRKIGTVSTSTNAHPCCLSNLRQLPGSKSKSKKQAVMLKVN